MRAAIGLLRLYAPRLSKMTMETIAPFLMRLPDDTNAADVFSNISEIKISHSNYNSICERHKFNPQEEGTAPMGTFSKLSGMLSPHVSNVSEGVDSQPKPIRKTSHVVRDFVSSFLSKQPNSA